MKNTVNLNSINLVNDDSLSYIKTLPDNCIDLIATDPPYFQVKTCAWDNQWPDVSAYLSWLDEMLAEFWRVLKPNGSLYLFCGSRLASDTEILLRERFSVLSHIIWAKPSGPWRRQNKESLRCFFPSTERLLFAEHYQGPVKGKGSEYHHRRDELKKNVFTPLIEYFRQAREALGITSKDIEQATGKKMSSHWFGFSQWQLPNEADYRKLQALFQRAAAERQQNNPYTVNIMIWSVSNIHSGVNIMNWQISISCCAVTSRYQLMCLIPMCGHSRRFSFTPESTPVKNRLQ